MELSEKRNRSVDLLKGILAIFIITLHFDFQSDSVVLKLFPFSLGMAVPMFLFLSGYLEAISFNNKKIETFSDAYSIKLLYAKLKRIIFPYAIFFVAEQILFRVWKIYSVGIFKYGILALMFDFLIGGIGQGSYYFPIIVQFIFLFPVIYFCIKKYGLKGLYGLFALNFFYEVLKQAYGMPHSEYRLLIFRYLFVISAGCFFALESVSEGNPAYAIKKKRLVMSVGFLLGFIFICLFCFTQYQPKIVTFWSTTSVLCCLYVVPIMALYMKKAKIVFAPLELIGKASWHIFLFQMLFYQYYYSTQSLLTENTGLRYRVCVLICVCGGVLFYLFEKGIYRVKIIIKH